MARKLIFLVVLATLALIAVRAEDDFKEIDDAEKKYMESKDDFKEIDDAEEKYVESKVEDDEESEARAPRRFRFGRFGGKRYGGSRSSIGTRSSSSGFFRRTRTSSGTSRGGWFRRTRSTGGSSSTRGGFRFGNRASRSGTRSGGFFRRARTSSRTSRGGFRFGNRASRSGTRSGGFRFGRRSRNGAGGSSRRRFTSRRTRQTTGGGSTGTNGGGGSGIGAWQKLGTIIDLAQLGAGVANTVLQQMSNVERKIVISLGNVEGASWQGGTAYMKEGSLIKVLPPNVPVEEGVLMGGVKKPGPSATGVSGAFCYGFEEAPESFCVMFKLPWSGENQWNVKVYPEQKQASESVYNDLQKDAIKASQPITKKVIYTGDGYQFFIRDASMTNSGQANLQFSFGIES
ncbi:keratin, type II cytoskeletal 1-like isoform X2 [Dendronephthya gigantea]|uniref:keratin, type II cytoskeletal 1-like isoform X2 n=1 Tax=Dendronephthya gigantea TaxID=151771 RepID=UPI00106CC667|nr:keratin, type II cytoskeletal 1-like isoform X2 [Dendronephthya gigantea]